MASTLYALASAQSCRFGAQVMPAASLGLPKEFARVIDAMLGKDKATRDAGGDYFMRNMPTMARAYVPDNPLVRDKALIPVWRRR